MSPPVLAAAREQELVLGAVAECTSKPAEALVQLVSMALRKAAVARGRQSRVVEAPTASASVLPEL